MISEQQDASVPDLSDYEKDREAWNLPRPQPPSLTEWRLDRSNRRPLSPVPAEDPRLEPAA